MASATERICPMRCPISLLMGTSQTVVENSEVKNGMLAFESKYKDGMIYAFKKY